MRTTGRSVIVLLIIAALLVPAMAVNAQGGTWSTGVNVQNLGTDVAHVSVKFYNPAGTLVYTYSVPAPIPVNGVATIYVPGIAGLDSGRYSGVVESDQPIAAVANNVDNGDLMGDSYLGSDPGAAQVVAPLWYRNFNNYLTKFYAQNASATAQSITIYLSRAGESAPAVTKSYTVQPYASQEIDLATSDFAALQGAYGSALVVGASGDVALVVTTNRMKGTADSNFNTEYRGIRTTLASKNLVAPLVYKNKSGWVTGIMVVNTETVAATVVVTYTASSEDTAHYPMVKVGTVSLGPLASTALYLPDPAASGLPTDPLPDGFFGAAELSSNTAILAIVNNTKSAPNVASAYEAFTKASATSKVAGPLVYKGFNGNDSGIQVQNVGNQPTDITMVLTKSSESSPSGGNGPWTFTRSSVPAGSVVTFYLPGESALAGVSALFGAVAISSSGGVPIVAVVNTTHYSAGMSMNYDGINN